MKKIILFFSIICTLIFGIQYYQKYFQSKIGNIAILTESIKTDLSNMRSVTYYNFPLELGSSRDFVTDFKNDIDKIVANRFNTVWFVVFRNYFNTSKDSYSEQSFIDLKLVLQELKNRNMQAILPLNYGNGPSYTACQILTDDAAYQDFVSYVTNFLTRISDYSDMTKILIFTEVSWGCPDPTVPKGEMTQVRGEALSKQIKNTLGKLPNDLPINLRNKFAIGFHDSYISEGWNQGTSTIFSENTYDFFSSTAYAGLGQPISYGLTIDENNPLISRIDNRITRIKTFYPNMPIIFGEVGASYCTNGTTELTQAEQDILMLKHLQNKNIGFNVWMWNPIHKNDPNSITLDCGFGGHAITNPDGTLKPVAIQIKELLKPVIESSTINPYSTNLAIALTGKNVYGPITAQVYINDQLTISNYPVTVGQTFSSFIVDSNIINTKCPDLRCKLEVIIIDSAGKSSNKQVISGTRPILNGHPVRGTTDTATIYLIENNTKRRYPNETLFLQSFTHNDVIIVADEVLDSFPSGKDVGDNSPTTKPGDLNGDGKVNIYDYAKLISGYGTIYSNKDFVNILTNYGK